MPPKSVRFSRIADLPHLELYRTTNVSACVPRHIHWVFSLSVIEAGVRIHGTKQEKYYVTPGSIAVVNLGEAHFSSTPDGCTASSNSLRVDAKMLNTLVRQVSGRDHATVHFRQPVIDDPDLFRQILNLCAVLGDCPSKLEMECLILAAFAKLCERHSREGLAPVVPGNEHTLVTRTCEFLQDCYNENVSLHRLGTIAGLSPFHLSRVFTKQIGVPPHTYQLQIRLKKATDLLASGRSIAEVAVETGFCDQSHFQRAFKRKFGITPGQYEW
ncbi:MAG TPA: AraC family transcriptional regulator [Negativicutes bacterium]|nr:AraC family transcriptional regulator [Negativicutes bacterium]